VVPADVAQRRADRPLLLPAGAWAIVAQAELGEVTRTIAVTPDTPARLSRARPRSIDVASWVICEARGW